MLPFVFMKTVYLMSTLLNASFVLHQREIIQMHCKVLLTVCFGFLIDRPRLGVILTEHEKFPFLEHANSSDMFSSHIWALLSLSNR